jgi:hypothetical protein
MTLGQVPLPRPLRQQLQQYLAGPPGHRLPVPPLRQGVPPIRPGVPPLRRGAARAGPCFVGVGSCSLVPCVQFVASRTPAAGSSCQGRLGAPKVLRVATP